MFKKGNRLSRNIRPALTRSFSTPFFTIKLGMNNTVHSRFSVVVSKKVDMRAVIRNKIKRIVRECLAKTGLQSGRDIVVIVKKQALGQEREVLDTSIREQVQKLTN